METRMQHIAFNGLGNMGTPTARNPVGVHLVGATADAQTGAAARGAARASAAVREAHIYCRISLHFSEFPHRNLN
jgi:3-hydroxyisobutyrate dehydrogenase-like beta-hydroxyacid dehydrogenase